MSEIEMQIQTGRRVRRLMDEASFSLRALAEDVEDQFPTRAENAIELATQLRRAIGASLKRDKAFVALATKTP